MSAKSGVLNGMCKISCLPRHDSGLADPKSKPEPHVWMSQVLSLQQLVRQEAWRLLVRFGVSQVRVHSQ